MRRCIPLGLRKLSNTDAERSISTTLHHEQFFSSFGFSTKYMVKESSVSEGKERLFDDEPHILHNIPCWTSLEALELIDQGCLKPDANIYKTLLKKCAELGRLEEGRIVHAHVLNSEFKDDISIHNNIILMYAKCGSLGEARKLFNGITSKDTVTWTSMIIAYSKNHSSEDALVLFPMMLQFGSKPNAFTFSSLLKASGVISSGKYGMQIHSCCVKFGCESNIYVSTSLVDMYARCGLMDEAQLIFSGLLTKNEVSWNALIAGHARKDEGEKALDLFQRMKREDFEPDQFTYSSIFSACAGIGALEQGKWVHADVIKSGIKLIDFVGNTLLHMYAKSGSIIDAEKVFSRLTPRTVISWNSMLSGYAQHGLGNKAVKQFEDMLKTGIKPNNITFLCVLTACSHAGLLERGKSYLNMMKNFDLEPKIEHYVTFVDLLGRAGKLDHAFRFIKDMPIDPTAEAWKALLGACRMHKNIELGSYAFERVIELDPHDSGPYIILCNIYASAGRKSDVAKVRKMMKENGVRKEPACSWVEIDNAVHMFVADDNSHPKSKEIYEKWEEINSLIKKIGYVADVSQVLLFVDENEREAQLQKHSEKLALAFALMKTPPHCTVRIKKNIRVCSDCHSAFKFVSKVTDREIILRDTNRFHHFRDGSCSCGDYW